MDSYRQGTTLLEKHLPHRHAHELVAVPSRLSWMTWEDCERVRPNACPWLSKSGGTRTGAMSEATSAPDHGTER